MTDEELMAELLANRVLLPCFCGGEPDTGAWFAGRRLCADCAQEHRSENPQRIASWIARVVKPALATDADLDELMKKERADD